MKLLPPHTWAKGHTGKGQYNSTCQPGAIMLGAAPALPRPMQPRVALGEASSSEDLRPPASNQTVPS